MNFGKAGMRSVSIIEAEIAPLGSVAGFNFMALAQAFEALHHHFMGRPRM